MSEKKTDGLSRTERRRATIYRLLERLVIRVVAVSERRDPRSYTDVDRDQIIRNHEAGMKHDLAQLMEVCADAKRDGIALAERVYRKIDTAPSDLVDEAIETARSQIEDD